MLGMCANITRFKQIANIAGFGTSSVVPTLLCCVCCQFLFRNLNSVITQYHFLTTYRTYWIVSLKDIAVEIRM